MRCRIFLDRFPRFFVIRAGVGTRHMSSTRLKWVGVGDIDRHHLDATRGGVKLLKLNLRIAAMRKRLLTSCYVLVGLSILATGTGCSNSDPGKPAANGGHAGSVMSGQGGTMSAHGGM